MSFTRHNIRKSFEGSTEHSKDIQSAHFFFKIVPKMKLSARSGCTKRTDSLIAIVAASSSNGGIGFQGQLPWKSLKADMAHFKYITCTPPEPGLTNAVIMGRKTWESIPPKFRPLSGRTNVVLSRQFGQNENRPFLNNLEAKPCILPEGVLGASSLQDATEMLSSLDDLGHVFVIGGAQIYQEALNQTDKVYYTKVGNCPPEMEFDAYFPTMSDDDWECVPFESSASGVDPVSGLSFEFLEYRRIPQGSQINPEEMQYLDLCRDILENGVRRGDRTGTGTLSKFGVQMRFSLRDDTLPLLTTKRTFWRGVAEELLWFISGSTNANLLQSKGINIWDGNGSREFLDSVGLSHREVGDLGPVYGFQWRHFGAKYVDMHTDYTGQGVDQLAECIQKIKNSPEDRRIIMSAWNPADLSVMALPPCHMFCQFYVADGELSCQMYQRSADMGLGVPFNIASYALLTHMMAQVCGLKPGDFVHTIGDAHIYLNHVDALKAQLQRLPRAFPKLKMNPSKLDIDLFEFSDFEILGYRPHKTIKMKMAV